MIFNTFQLPTRILRDMEKMKDVELRIVLLIAFSGRPTRSSLISDTGKKSTSVSGAIRSCLKQGWIVAVDENGKSVKTVNQRMKLGRGKEIHYLLASYLWKQ